MKKFIQFLIIVIIFGTIFFFRKDITNFLTNTSSKLDDKEIEIPENNEYKLNYDNFNYVKSTNNFVPNNKQEIENIIYTTLNSGWKTFTFYCPDEYNDCVNDTINITNDEVILSNINGFVHPFNSFRSIETTYTNSGKVTLLVHNIYKKEEIDAVNKEIDKIMSTNITDAMTNREKIKTLHDYIINNSKYDDERVGGVIKYNSNTAYGNLIQGYGICSGYADTMAIMLNRLNIPNYKISSDNHIWNLVYIDNEWKHLDVTFDDPVTNTGEDVLQDNYFLIDTTTLLNLDKNEHTFDSAVFVEAK